MTKIIDDLRVYLKIDKYSLDDEIIKQPSLYFNVSDAYVEAVAERDACKEELATIDAELDGVVRRTLKEKSTEAMVKHGIQTHQKHNDAFDTYILAKTKCDKLQALKEAFHQRSQMIGKLTDLYCANYFERSSVQGVSRADKNEYERHRERLADARLNRKSR